MSINDLKDSITAIENTLKHDPTNVHALINLGSMYMEYDAPHKGFLYLQKAVNIAPDFAGAWNALFMACKNMNKLEDLVTFCDTAISTYPGNTLAWSYKGYAFEYLHKYENALAAYKHAAGLSKGRYDLWERMGSIHARTDSENEALTCLRMAIEHGSKNFHTLLNYAKILRIRGEVAECQEYCLRILDMSPDYTPALIELGMALIDQGEFDNAASYLNKAKDIAPENTDIASGLAQAYDRLGNHEEAYNAIRPFLESGLKDPSIACTYAKVGVNIGKAEDAVRFIEEILLNGHPSLHQRIDLHFMAGNVYDKLGNFSDAMHHFDKANSLKPTNFDKDVYAGFIDNMTACFSKKTITSLPRSGCSDEGPVFIVGMMRSGTSLVEQILASHDNVYGCGELMGITLKARETGLYQYIHESGESVDKFLTREILEVMSQDYLNELPEEAHSKKRFTDKMPLNFLNLGLIALLFPNSRVIHIKRNPLDTCLSTYFINFSGRHDFAYSLDNLGFYYRQYERLMHHWHDVLPLPILDIVYEDLVTNTEEVCHSILDFCDLDWDDKVLDFHTTERLVNTASYNQVRRPIYTSSVGYWKNYEEYLEPLRTALGI